MVIIEYFSNLQIFKGSKYLQCKKCAVFSRLGVSPIS